MERGIREEDKRGKRRGEVSGTEDKEKLRLRQQRGEAKKQMGRNMEGERE